jgi:hypothetical protein
VEAEVSELFFDLNFGYGDSPKFIRVSHINDIIHRRTRLERIEARGGRQDNSQRGKNEEGGGAHR